MATAATAPIRSPWGASFSTHINTVSRAIHNMFMTPMANAVIITAQQQPTQ